MTVIALKLGDIFHFFFHNVGLSTYCRRVVVTLFLALLAPKTPLLVVLVLLASLALVDKKLLALAIRYTSGMSVNRLSPSGVFFLLFCGLFPLGAP